MQNLFELTLLWVVGALASASVLKIWFDTTLLCLLIKLVRALGWRRKTDGYWNVPDYEWDNWLRFQAMSWADGKVPNWVHHLWSCPGCFATHVGFWVSLVIATCSREWWLLPIGFSTYVWTSLWLFGKVSDTALSVAYKNKKKEEEWRSKQ